MSFVGLVTRKEEDTGVSLMAKIVTPNKKRSAKKIFKVKVKANALDDYSCCVIDHATAKSRIENSQDMLNLIDDLTLPYSGVNGTTISYAIINNTSASVYPLTDYLGEDGTILGRPKFNAESSGAATGYLEITVTKGTASVQSRIVVAVAGTTAEEILATSTYNEAQLWGLIAGRNTGNYVKGNSSSPHNNIQYNLTFSNARSLMDPNSVTPITIDWTVEDSLVPYLSASHLALLNEELGGKPRITADGAVTRASYGASCAVIGQVSGITGEIIGTADASTSSINRRVRINGITITAVLTLGASQKTIVFNCATVSKYITSKEIMEVVKKNMTLFNANDARIAYKDEFDGVFTTLAAPSSGGKTFLKAFGNTAADDIFFDTSLHLSIGDISNVEMSHIIYAADGTSSPDANMISYGLGGGFVDDASGGNPTDYQVLNIDYDFFHNSLSGDLRKFTIFTTVTVRGYSTSGEDLSSTPMYLNKYAQIAIDTTAMV